MRPRSASRRIVDEYPNGRPGAISRSEHWWNGRRSRPSPGPRYGACHHRTRGRRRLSGRRRIGLGVSRGSAPASIAGGRHRAGSRRGDSGEAGRAVRDTDRAVRRCDVLRTPPSRQRGSVVDDSVVDNTAECDEQPVEPLGHVGFADHRRSPSAAGSLRVDRSIGMIRLYGISAIGSAALSAGPIRARAATVCERNGGHRQNDPHPLLHRVEHRRFHRDR